MAEMETASRLKERFPGISEDAVAKCWIAAAEDIYEVCLFLRKALFFDYLDCLSGVDYKDKLAVVYHLYSFSRKEKICLKVFLGLDNPELKSVTAIYPAANWHEREAFDMFGISFTGHPDLRRILLPDGWQGYPLRKDYSKEGFVPLPQVH